jgi:N-acetylglutamate synthase
MTRADETSAAIVESWRHVMDVHPTAWCEGAGDTWAIATDIPSPALNGVWSSNRDPDPGEVGRLLDLLAARRLPHMLQVRDEALSALAGVAAARAMTRDDDADVMRLDDPARLAGARVEGLVIRELEAEQAAVHAHLAAAAFGESPEAFVRLVVPELLRAGVTTAYVGELDGELVTTALGANFGPHVAVFNVATVEPHRRRGYGAAITARAVEDAFAAGARWAWLQSTLAGRRIYEALGFETVERWPTWTRS